jgi:hypothetical protein
MRCGIPIKAPAHYFSAHKVRTGQYVRGSGNSIRRQQRLRVRKRRAVLSRLFFVLTKVLLYYIYPPDSR